MLSSNNYHEGLRFTTNLFALYLDITPGNRTNSVVAMPPSPNPSEGTTGSGQNRKWHKASLGGMMRNASTTLEKGLLDKTFFRYNNLQRLNLRLFNF